MSPGLVSPLNPGCISLILLRCGLDLYIPAVWKLLLLARLVLKVRCGFGGLGWPCWCLLMIDTLMVLLLCSLRSRRVGVSCLLVECLGSVCEKRSCVVAVCRRGVDLLNRPRELIADLKLALAKLIISGGSGGTHAATHTRCVVIYYALASHCADGGCSWMSSA